MRSSTLEINIDETPGPTWAEACNIKVSNNFVAALLNLVRINVPAYR